MGYLIILVAALVAGWFVLSASLYLAGLVLVVAGAAGLGIGIVQFATAAFAGFAADAPIAHLRMEPPTEGEGERDPVYRSYYAGPVLLDHWRTVDQSVRRMWSTVVVGDGEKAYGTDRPSLVSRAWSVPGRYGSTYWKLLVFLPALAAVAGLVGGVVGAIALMAATSVVFVTLLGCLVLSTLATVGVAWSMELCVLFVRGITIECPQCNVRATRPVYRCPECQATHRRLMPGLAGVLRHTCRCRNILPTLLAFGKAKLPAQCAECHTQLPIKGLTAPTFHVPVIAGPAAGKSVYMHTAVTRLMVRGAENGEGFEFADERAKAAFDRNITLGVSDDPTKITKTTTARPRAYNVYVGREGSLGRRLLYLYDPAGETAESVDRLAEAHFLQFTKGIVFVIDPFSLRAVRSLIDRAVLRQVNASNTDAKPVLERFVESLRERLSTGRSPRLNIAVAVVLTKADALLDSSDVDHPYAGLPAATNSALRAERNAAVRTWLSKVGGRSDLVSSLDNHFASVSYFVVSYQDAKAVSARSSPSTLGQVSNDDPAAPLVWLLTGKAAT
ncbi:hypothetical protein F0L68_17740 [Solihabitans fulvus]|uniref:Double-GTPase 2 domain-containing protein n=1 Tax=Solihabitans fulvus TaxID=1892852 RepID=A0A5B2XDW8_9PSEU|nr:hypothetical protein [Solihabitans fulvus]KAA2261295.1 hypothetical protein F0L68_17740 [Solihabitans fulvus]